MSIVNKHEFDPPTSEALLVMIQQITSAIAQGKFDKHQTENLCGVISQALKTAI